MYNFNIARDKISEFHSDAQHNRQIKEAKKGDKKPASEKALFGLFLRRSYRPARLSAERRAELIQQEWKA